MKQLDVDVSQPAFVWNSELTLTHMTFDLDLQTFDLRVICQTIYAKSMQIMFLAYDRDPRSYTFSDMNFGPVTNAKHSESNAYVHVQ